MENTLRLPWKTQHAPDALDDYLNVVDCDGRAICTVYAVQTNGKAAQIRYILEMCNPKPQQAEVVAISEVVPL